MTDLNLDIKIIRQALPYMLSLQTHLVQAGRDSIRPVTYLSGTGGLTIERMAKGKRCALFFEPDERVSGWFVIEDQPDGARRQVYGTLNDFSVRKFVKALII